jgi:hypothetical protein
MASSVVEGGFNVLMPRQLLLYFSAATGQVRTPDMSIDLTNVD